MNRLWRKLHRLFFFALVVILFACAYPLLRFYARDSERYYAQISKVRRWISSSSLRIAGIRLRISYETPIDWNKNYILCANHTSFLDIAILSSLSEAPFSFVGKIELLSNPITRIFFKTIDIPIDRENRVSSFKAFKRADEVLKKGNSVAIFPEGKIDDIYPPRLHPFKRGAFRLATDNQVAIIPIIVLNAWEILWDDGAELGSKPGDIHIQMLAPVTLGDKNAADYVQQESAVYEKMKEAWDSYNEYSQ